MWYASNPTMTVEDTARVKNVLMSENGVGEQG
jgi:hypothetical protein